MEQEIWEIASVFLMSTVKFVFGAVPMALAMGFSFFETVVVTSLGGFTGVLFFVFLSDTLVKKIKAQKEKKKNDQTKQPNKKKFTKKNKIIVFIKRKFGIVGISLITPLLLSIPLGSFLAVRYFKNKQQIIAYMFGSILFWSVSIASFKLFF
ncbi:MAG: hypothetical protein L6Q66_01615 [Bacteroidia bacterium]|nr:hypothetical protein [Bacteroidia bacterium]